MGGKHWTQEEDEYLMESWGCLSVPLMASRLHRTREAVCHRARDFGLGPYLENGDYITVNTLYCTFNGLSDRGGTRSKYQRWMDHGLPFKKKVCCEKIIYTTTVAEFWKWAETMRDFLNFTRMEPLSLGPEPDWVAEQRRRDFADPTKQGRGRKWTPEEDAMLAALVQRPGCTYQEISSEMGRSAAAIRTRLVNLGIEARPHRTYPIPWTEDQYQALETGILAGETYFSIGLKLNRTAQAISCACRERYGCRKIQEVRAEILRRREENEKATRE